MFFGKKIDFLTTWIFKSSISHHPVFKISIPERRILATGGENCLNVSKVVDSDAKQHQAKLRRRPYSYYYFPKSSVKHCRMIVRKHRIPANTVVWDWESSRPHLCSKLTLFKTSWQVLKVVLCCFLNWVPIDMAWGFQMHNFLSS